MAKSMGSQGPHSLQFYLFSATISFERKRSRQSISWTERLKTLHRKCLLMDLSFNPHLTKCSLIFPPLYYSFYFFLITFGLSFFIIPFFFFRDYVMYSYQSLILTDTLTAFTNSVKGLELELNLPTPDFYTIRVMYFNYIHTF